MRLRIASLPQSIGASSFCNTRHLGRRCQFTMEVQISTWISAVVPRPEVRCKMHAVAV
uniref:Uncharacterized protein n=1 Tax=Arundo donax TaxID=35708 RepID=A0A0A9B5M7_ARUDO